MQYFLFSLIIIGVLVLLANLIKSKKFFRCILSSSVQGIAALFAVNLLGMVTGLHISVNWITIVFSMIFGTPGVIALTLSQFLFTR